VEKSRESPVFYGWIIVFTGLWVTLHVVDRNGPRTVMFVGMLIFALGTMLLSQLTSLWHQRSEVVPTPKSSHRPLVRLK
jgi:zinc transporter ZupT